MTLYNHNRSIKIFLRNFLHFLRNFLHFFGSDCIMQQFRMRHYFRMTAFYRHNLELRNSLHFLRVFLHFFLNRPYRLPLDFFMQRFLCSQAWLIFLGFAALCCKSIFWKVLRQIPVLCQNVNLQFWHFWKTPLTFFFVLFFRVYNNFV